MKPWFSHIFSYLNVTLLPTILHCKFFVFRYKTDVVHLLSLWSWRIKKRNPPETQYWCSLRSILEKNSYIFTPISSAFVFPHSCFIYWLQSCLKSALLPQNFPHRPTSALCTDRRRRKRKILNFIKIWSPFVKFRKGFKTRALSK